MGRRKKINRVSNSEVVLFLVKPFLIAVGLVVFISISSRWFFEYALEIEGIAENIWLFWIPCFLTLLFWILLLRRRINLLNIPNWNGNGNFLWHTTILLSLALTGIFGQFYQKRINLSEVSIHHAREIEPTNWNACYDFPMIQLDKELATGDQFAKAVGRHNSELEYSAYILAPFGTSENGHVVFWAGKVYKKRIRNRTSDSHKEYVWDTHYSNSFQRFHSLEKKYDEFLYPVSRGEDFENYMDAIHRIDWPDGTEHRVFEFYDGNLSSDANNVLIGSIFSFLAGLFALWLFGFRGFKKTGDYVDFQKGTLKYGDMEASVFRFLLLQGDSPITAIIVYLCLLGFIISAFIDGNLIELKTERLLDYGALSKNLVAEGEIWRLVSHMFLHGGFMHILYNLFILGFIGVYMEPMVGKFKFTIIYLVTGLGSAFLSLTFNDSISVGASGAIYGLMGWYISASFIYKKRLGENGNYGLMVIGYVCLSFLLGFLSMQVDHYAHLGGLLTGLILGVTVAPKPAR